MRDVDVVVVEIDALRRADGAVHTFCFANRPYAPSRQPGVLQSDLPCPTLVTEDVAISTSIALAGGRGEIEIGPVTLSNPRQRNPQPLIGWDGEGPVTLSPAGRRRPLNRLMDDYHLGGRSVRVRVGGASKPRLAMPIMYAGVTEPVQPAAAGVTLQLADGALRYDRPLRSAAYSGAGGLGGGGDLKDRRKEWALGAVWAAEPTYLGIVEEGLPTWSIAGGDPIDGVAVVRSAWVDLTEVATTPAAGQWRQDKTRGLFWLGGSPQHQISAKVKGAKLGGAYRSLPGDIMAYAALGCGAAPSSSAIDWVDVAALNLVAPWDLGVWFGAGSDVTCRRLLDDVAGSVGAWWRIDAAGMLRMGMIQDPAALEPTATLRRSVDHLGLTPVTASGRDAPPGSVIVRYGRNYVSTSPDIDRAVDPEIRAAAARSYREARATMAAAAVYGAAAAEKPLDTLIYSDVHAAAAAAAAAARLGREWRQWSAPLSAYRPEIQPGAGVIVYDDAPGFDAGRRALVLASKLNLRDRRQTLVIATAH